MNLVREDKKGQVVIFVFDLLQVFNFCSYILEYYVTGSPVSCQKEF